MPERTDVSMTNEDKRIKRKENMVMVLSTIGQEYTFKTPDDIETLYLYRDGVYVPAETAVKARIEEILGDDTDSHFVLEVLNHLKRRSYIPRDNVNNYGGFVPVENGLLNLETLELVPHDPAKVFTFKIPTRFDKDAKCPKFKEFMSQVQPAADVRDLIQEYSGYCLLPAFSHHKFMVLSGSGRNGKGTFIRTLEGVLGQENVAHVRLEYLDGTHRFAVANLYGALLNVCSEPSTREPFQTEVLKMITGQDTIDAEIKNKQKNLRFRSFAKFYVQANHLPEVNDTTLSFWDRVLMTTWEETFTDEKGNKTPDIERTWLDSEQERSGVLNWMIAGLKRLGENGRFTETKSQSETVLLWKQVSDPIGAFLSDPRECQHGPELEVTREDLYNRYKDYSETLEVPAESNRTFADRMRRQPGIKDEQARVGGKKARIWKGIGLVKRPDDKSQTDLQ